MKFKLLKYAFVDGILIIANSTEAILERQVYLRNICSMVQLKLRKWDSFNSELLETVSEDARAMSPLVLFNSS